MDLSIGSAVVTGGASGLGLATAVALAEAGADVTAIDLPTAVDRIAGTEEYDGITFRPADITDPDSIRDALDHAAAGRPLRAVVHCAGRGGDRVRILDRAGSAAPVDTFNAVIQTNLIGTYNVLRLAAAAMCRNDVVDGDRGAIVMTASVAAFEGQIGQTSYAAAKAGVHGMTIVAARDLANWAIRVNTIAPGVFDTPMLGRFSEEMRGQLASSTVHPHRLGAAHEYARLALEILRNSYLNGQTIRLDAALRMPPR